MSGIDVLKKWKQKYFSGYERGIVTASEFTNALIELMLDAENDETCLDLCSDLPEWSRKAFLDRLEALEKMDFYCRSFGIGDMRTEQQVHSDALRQQELLRRLASKIRNILQLGRCST